jgi:hypothetical protein
VNLLISFNVLMAYAQVLRQDYAYQMQRTESAYGGASQAAAAVAAQHSDAGSSSSGATASLHSSIEQQQQQAFAEGFVSIETHVSVLNRCASMSILLCIVI